MIKTAILIIILIPISKLYSQSEEKNKFNDLKLPDSLKSLQIKMPLLYLKTEINKNIFEMNKHDVHSQNLIKLYLEGATKEDFDIGFTDEELLAFLKNKNQLKSILQKNYDESWWYRVKGVDELLGIPHGVFTILKLAFLLGL